MRLRGKKPEGIDGAGKEMGRFGRKSGPFVLSSGFIPGGDFKRRNRVVLWFCFGFLSLLLRLCLCAYFLLNVEHS